MQIAATLLPWNVGTVVMWAALAALEDQAGLVERVKYNNEQIAYIEEMMGSIPGMVVFPSKANYVLLDAGPTGWKTQDILAYAQTKGLILRGESPKRGSEGWFRVTIGSKEENELFVKTMREYFSK